MSYFSRFLIASVVFALWACNPTSQGSLEGSWRGDIFMQEAHLPFNFELVKKSADDWDMILRNAEEEILLPEVGFSGDSLKVNMHVFDAQLLFKVVDEANLTGVFRKNYLKDYVLPVEATRGTQRFIRKDSESAATATGTWEVTFFNEEDTTAAIGVLENTGKKLTGTFLTATGDYRYLEGTATSDSLFLSTFDGSHAFLFTGGLQAGDSITGDFYSGKSWKQSWTAVRNPDAKLPHPDSLTFLKPGYETITFRFPTPDGTMISPHDPQFDGKVRIIQILGTWCPNCMDETRFLAKWYTENQDKPVEIIGLAYEVKPDFEYAARRVEKMKEMWDVQYPIAIAGVSNKKKAAETLPMLNKILSFPTTIFMDKNGKVRKIHTGFSGPGTGKYYEKFVEEFNLLMDKLIAEEE